jgi:hypothetical protein
LLVGAHRRRVTDQGVEEAGLQPGAEEEADPSVGVVDRGWGGIGEIWMMLMQKRSGKCSRMG